MKKKTPPNKSRNPYVIPAKRKKAGVIKPRTTKRPKSKKQLIEEESND
jgi:hypothetical protein